jgi:hypothetical protein
LIFGFWNLFVFLVLVIWNLVDLVHGDARPTTSKHYVGQAVRPLQYPVKQEISAMVILSLTSEKYG